MDGMSTYYTTTATDAASSAGMGGAIAGMFATYGIVFVIALVLEIIAYWKIFTKAGEAGWKSLIPIYNTVIMFKISGLSPWLILLFLVSAIPVVGSLVVLGLMIFQRIKLGKAFGRSTGFIVGMILLGSIFDLILGFGSAEYVGTSND